MNIGFDVSDLATNRSDGTTRYTRELLMRMPFLRPHDTWQLYSPGDIGIENLPTNIKKNISAWPKYWTQMRLPFDLYATNPDVLFMPIQQLPIFRPKKMKTVAVVHDLAFHKFPKAFTYKDWALLHIFTAQVAREADVIIAVSKATADDIAHYYGRTENVHVIHHGVDHAKFHVSTDEEKSGSWAELVRHYPNLKKPYILYVGQIQPRKNLVRLIEAFETLSQKQPGLQLVITGGHGWKQQEILAKVNNSSVKDFILTLGAVPDTVLPALYAHSEVFTLVSLYEGFGMPILEAMASGTPVVTSDVSCMPEVAGGAAVIINPMSVDSIAAGIQEAMDKRTIYSEAGLTRAKQFDWDKTAQKTQELLQ